jgi:Retrotransposon gag protein
MVVSTRSTVPPPFDDPLPPPPPLEQQMAYLTIEAHEMNIQLNQRILAQESQTHQMLESFLADFNNRTNMPPSNFPLSQPFSPPAPFPSSSFHKKSRQPPSSRRNYHAHCQHDHQRFHPHHHYDSDFRHHLDTAPFHDSSRSEEGWHTHDSSTKWHPPRAELSKFDGSNVMDWLEDCEFSFEVTHTPGHRKVQTTISYFIGEAREWYQYYKLSNFDPYWSNFKEEILDRFGQDSLNPVDEFKRIQQTGKVDEFIQQYERVRDRVPLINILMKNIIFLAFLVG